MMLSKFKLACLIILIAPFLNIGVSHADTKNQPQGLIVSPAFQQVSIPDGASSVPIAFTITNNRPSSQDISLSVQDFNALNESGGLFFVGTNPTALQKKYGLAKWISLSTDHITVPANQTVKVNASVLNLPDLSPGGHYGALMLSLGAGESSQGVGLHPIASSLLFVTKPQGAVYQLNLTNVYVAHRVTSLPAKVTLRFYNPGNTHVTPRGVVNLMSPSGKLISKGIINENSDLILPGNYRQYKVNLHTIDKSRGVGNYKLRVDFRFDGIGQYRSYRQTMFYISVLDLVMITIVAIGVLGALMFYYRGHFIK